MWCHRCGLEPVHVSEAIHAAAWIEGRGEGEGFGSQPIGAAYEADVSMVVWQYGNA